MTSTTTEAGRRVYVRRLGYATVLDLHGDHSATVRFEDGGGQERIPFGDWAYDRSAPDAETSSIEMKARIKTALRLDFGEDFAETNSGITPHTGASWFRARYGDYMVNVTVTPAS